MKKLLNKILNKMRDCKECPFSEHGCAPDGPSIFCEHVEIALSCLDPNTKDINHFLKSIKKVKI